MPISCHFQDCKALLFTSLKQRYIKYRDLYLLPFNVNTSIDVTGYISVFLCCRIARHVMSWFVDDAVRTTRQLLKPMKCRSSWVNRPALTLMSTITSCVRATLGACARRASCTICVIRGWKPARGQCRPLTVYYNCHFWFLTAYVGLGSCCGISWMNTDRMAPQI